VRPVCRLGPINQSKLRRSGTETNWPFISLLTELGGAEMDRAINMSRLTALSQFQRQLLNSEVESDLFAAGCRYLPDPAAGPKITEPNIAKM
jgi:hypothetical protein